MKLYRGLVALIVLLVLCHSDVIDARSLQSRPDGVAANRASHRQDRVIVQMKVSSETPANKPRYKVMPVRPTETVEQAIARYQRDPKVEYAEPDYDQFASVLPESYQDGSNHYRTWGQKKVSAPAAWDTVTGTTEKICVIDSGIDYNHPALTNRMDPTYRTGFNAVKCVLNTANPLSTTCSSTALDDNNHGTHCAGIIAGQGSTTGSGVPGVNWGGANLIPCKFLNSRGSGSTADALECITWCVAAGAKVLSNSWGGGGYSKALEDEIRRVGNLEDPAVLVFANGNESTDMDSAERQPVWMNLPNMIGVGSSMASDIKSSFSNYGTSASHIAAPGHYIWSSIRGGSYANYSGTSMACPYVAGALALMKAAAPTQNYLALRANLLSSGYDQISVSRFTEEPAAGKAKRLNLALAVANAGNSWAPATSITAPSGESTIALTASSGVGTSSSLSLARSGNNWITVSSDIKELINQCNSVNSARFKISNWPKNFHKVTLSGFTNGVNATWDSGCGSSSWDSVLAVIKCTGTSTLTLSTCTCYVDDDGCGSGGGPSKVSNVPMDSASTYYVANLPYSKSTTSGSWLVRVTASGAGGGGSGTPTCGALNSACTSGSQCCSGRCRKNKCS